MHPSLLYFLLITFMFGSIQAAEEVAPEQAAPQEVAPEEAAPEEAAPEEPSGEEVIINNTGQKVRPEHSDATSLQIISNFLTAIGGEDVYSAIKNLKVTGSMREGLRDKTFTLLETREGNKQLITKWRHLGYSYTESMNYNGAKVWSQELEPKKSGIQMKENSAGKMTPEAKFFVRQRWMLHPFTKDDDFVYKYRGPGKVGARKAHVLVGYSKEGAKSWFYFDQENFLLLRWGGEGVNVRRKLSNDYRASQFKRVDGVLLPAEIELLLDGEVYGKMIFDEITFNVEIPKVISERREHLGPVLKQVIRSQ